MADPLSIRTRRVSGPPQRLTFGTGLEIQPALGTTISKERAIPLVFASLSANMDIWSLPLRTNGAPASAEPERLTEDLSADFVHSLSPDGKKMIFLSNRSGKFELWMKDLEKRREAPYAGVQGRSMFSADGSSVGYTVAGANSPIYMAPASGGIAEKLCDDCGAYWDWSSDRKRIIYVVGGPDRIHFELLNLTSGKRIKFLQEPKFDLYLPNLSPDDRWISFLARPLNSHRKVYIAPFTLDRTLGEPDWIAITGPGEVWVDAPVWSADSNRLYFLSEIDGFRCLWGQELNLATKHPLGKAFPVYHSHRSRQSLMNLTWGHGALAVSRDRTVFGQGELTGNIWMTKLPVSP